MPDDDDLTGTATLRVSIVESHIIDWRKADKLRARGKIGSLARFDDFIDVVSSPAPKIGRPGGTEFNDTDALDYMRAALEADPEKSTSAAADEAISNLDVKGHGVPSSIKARLRRKYRAAFPG